MTAKYSMKYSVYIGFSYHGKHKTQVPINYEHLDVRNYLDGAK